MKNLNGGEEVTHRNPQEIMNEIAVLDAESAEVLGRIKALLWTTPMKIIPAIFDEREIRRLYDEKTEMRLFSVIDIIQVLTQQPDYQASRKYWKVLKGRLAKEGSELVTNCYQLKMAAEDGKPRLTDVANAETNFVDVIPQTRRLCAYH